MSTVIQTFPFRFNKDETDPALRFPDLSLRAYSFNIQIGSSFYSVRATYNYWTNNAQVSVYDQNQTPLIQNVGLIQTVATNFPNYLYGQAVFSGYYLTWDIGSQIFSFSSN